MSAERDNNAALIGTEDQGAVGFLPFLTTQAGRGAPEGGHTTPPWRERRRGHKELLRGKLQAWLKDKK
jgi:hypothetical protein